jgi:hypothetical protein
MRANRSASGFDPAVCCMSAAGEYDAQIGASHCRFSGMCMCMRSRRVQMRRTFASFNILRELFVLENRNMFLSQALLHVLQLLTFVAITKASCYLPSGAEQDGVRCSSDTEHSACCFSGNECFTNGLCKDPYDAPINKYWRYGCTDPSWQSPDCPKYCYTGSTGEH